jgi:hypothetical protein
MEMFSASTWVAAETTMANIKLKKMKLFFIGPPPP